MRLRVGGILNLSGLRGDRVNLRYGRVNGALVLAGDDGQLFRPNRDSGILDLRNVKIDVLKISDQTPLPRQTWLRGAEFRNVEVDISKREGGTHTEIAREASVLVGFLEQVDFKASGAEMYKVFQRSYSSLDHERAAGEIAYAKEHRVTKHTKGWRKAMRYLSYIFGGYGLRPERTLGIAVVFTILGAIFLFLSIEGRVFLAKQKPFPKLIGRVAFRNCNGVSSGFTDEELVSRTFGNLGELWYTRWMIWKVFDSLVFSLDRFDSDLDDQRSASGFCV